jgi:hypothetical protein
MTPLLKEADPMQSSLASPLAALLVPAEAPSFGPTLD